MSTLNLVWKLLITSCLKVSHLISIIKALLLQQWATTSPTVYHYYRIHTFLYQLINTSLPVNPTSLPVNPHISTSESLHLYQWIPTSLPVNPHISTSESLHLYQWIPTSLPVNPTSLPVNQHISTSESPHLYQWIPTSLPVNHHISTS
jgi:hypothetical protein